MNRRCLRCRTLIRTGSYCADCHRVGKRLYGSPAWKRTRAMARLRDGNQCVKCGTTEKLDVHHEQPVREGGNPFDLDNLVTLCARCHAAAEHDTPVF